MTLTYHELSKKISANISLEELKQFHIDNTSFIGEDRTPAGEPTRANHPITVANGMDRLDIFEYLLENGANLDYSYSSYPLKYINHFFINNKIDFIKAIIRILPKEDLENIDKGNRYAHETMLSYAAEKGNKELVDMLIAKGLNPDSQYYDEYSKGIAAYANEAPIFTAAKAGYDDIVKSLLKAGANPTYTGNYYDYAMTTLYVESNEIINIYAARNNIEMVELIVEAEGSTLLRESLWPDVKVNDFFDKLVIEAAKENFVESLKLFLPKIDNFTVLNEALKIAAAKGNTEACKVLVENKADVHFVGSDGYMPSITALKNGHTDTAKFLEHELLATEISVNEAFQEISENLANFEVINAVTFAGKLVGNLFDTYIGLNVFTNDNSEA